jgi:hypothetical protein
MNETKFRGFKPDTGADFYDEDFHSSPKNIMKKEFNKLGKIIIREESPDNKINMGMASTSNLNFLPQITMNRKNENITTQQRNKKI